MRATWTILATLFFTAAAVLLWYSTQGDRTWHFVAASFAFLAALISWEERHRT